MKRGSWESRASAQGQAGFTQRKIQESREGEVKVREWRKQLNTILLQAPVEATFKCVSVLSGCRIT